MTAVGNSGCECSVRSALSIFTPTAASFRVDCAWQCAVLVCMETAVGLRKQI
jgi:hypothetical protein